ncbi:hypothetical protein VOLCADRAFT_98152 [Volvox carteri f. nagariensis]|uniref:Uncharacterized protein n=1 Tax=Volvox carteri f. nagariensis TaxID=3068 RepID=D8UEK8_VOLCA|nr:uncharacterized protein VOLCADRAFT_98152 [Volvox carteri f. nagariensis]EFJ41860.1 hypothetical protein VOLCADRAFT_98152 [Volvox carteri f. nagariensis]|eukprot:XP_002957058.1 hypothetical protein VOLCADRAFT_98152 [Volvox carteri f. nagariensis]
MNDEARLRQLRVQHGHVNLESGQHASRLPEYHHELHHSQLSYGGLNQIAYQHNSAPLPMVPMGPIGPSTFTLGPHTAATFGVVGPMSQQLMSSQQHQGAPMLGSLEGAVHPRGPAGAGVAPGPGKRGSRGGESGPSYTPSAAAVAFADTGKPAKRHRSKNWEEPELKLLGCLMSDIWNTCNATHVAFRPTGRKNLQKKAAEMLDCARTVAKYMHKKAGFNSRTIWQHEKRDIIIKKLELPPWFTETVWKSIEEVATRWPRSNPTAHYHIFDAQDKRSAELVTGAQQGAGIEGETDSGDGTEEEEGEGGYEDRGVTDDEAGEDGDVEEEEEREGEEPGKEQGGSDADEFFERTLDEAIAEMSGQAREGRCMKGKGGKGAGGVNESRPRAGAGAGGGRASKIATEGAGGKGKEAGARGGGKGKVTCGRAGDAEPFPSTKLSAGKRTGKVRGPKMAPVQSAKHRYASVANSTTSPLSGQPALKVLVLGAPANNHHTKHLDTRLPWVTAATSFPLARASCGLCAHGPPALPTYQPLTLCNPRRSGSGRVSYM